ncbi:hypothetical protein [Marinobacter sp. DY40_1A1]|nr:hypothetical protein [Marinobacter sp. DY40_1A1]MBK1887773.1 hypothetical protein [Marinobacter sp. DY40_1A1]
MHSSLAGAYSKDLVQKVDANGFVERFDLGRQAPYLMEVTSIYRVDL